MQPCRKGELQRGVTGLQLKEEVMQELLHLRPTNGVRAPYNSIKLPAIVSPSVKETIHDEGRDFTQ